MIALAKFVHIAALSLWCAALIALPLVLAAYGGARRQARFAEFRLMTHMGYIAFATPAAIIAIAAGTVLVFAAGIFAPWLMLKLVAVAGMVLVHVWLGHIILQSGERGGAYRMPSPLIGLGLAAPLMLAVLWLVLAKPDLSPLVPGWALSPRVAP